MRKFTALREADTADELWLLGHQPVYTLGQAADSMHILNSGDIPVIKIDRGGQVTYHGPGQIMFYLLADLRRHGLGVRQLVELLENTVIELLAGYGVQASGNREAPGVYVNGNKIAALGLRISRGCSYHGLCLNYQFDATPFAGINPCGYSGMQVTQLSDCVATLPAKQRLVQQFIGLLQSKLGYSIEQGSQARVLNWPP
ncbi:MAG: lipoyl(octanoyl) transferase LipB [Pseudomonadales bacterium]|nr:lipoyl(octanoyl) transferase LipB [Pseudomonadales bacterium]